MNSAQPIGTGGSLHSTVSILCTILAAITFGLAERSALAASHTTSTNVALIPNTTGGGFGGGSAGTLNTAWFPGVHFTVVNPASVTSPASLAPYDTVLIWQFCNVGSFPAFTSNLV